VTRADDPRTLRAVRSIYLIDDSPDDTEAVQRHLERASRLEFPYRFEVTAAANGMDGIALCSHKLPDCLLLDFYLGDMDAVQFLQSLSRLHGKEELPCPVVVLSSIGSEKLAVSLLRAGAQDYLLKDVLTPESLVSAIDNALEKVSLRQRLQRSEARFREALDPMPECFGIFRIVGGTFAPEYLNEAAVQCDSRVPEALLEHFQTVSQTERTLSMSLLGPFSRHDTRIWAIEGGCAAAWRDVTDVAIADRHRRQAEQALTDAHRRLSFHIENTPLANLELDAELRVLSWSQQACEVFGWGCPEIVGHAWWELPFIPEAERQAQACQWEVRKRDPSCHTQAHLGCFQHKDGQAVWCQWQFSLERDMQGRLVSVLGQGLDLTERVNNRMRLEAGLARESNIARTLQSSLLTRPPHDAFHGIDFHMLYEAASPEAEVGGDFYDIFPVSDERIAIIIGDITGKGLDAARYVAELKYSLRAHLSASGDIERALSQVNATAIALKERNEEKMFCVNVHLYHPGSGKLEVVQAGLEPSVLFSADGTVRTLDDKPCRPLNFAADTVFTVCTYLMQPGDVLFTYTDGLSESRADDGTFLGTDELIGMTRECLTDLCCLDAAATELLKRVKDFGMGRLRDDACLVLARAQVDRAEP
jgi:PAS domain S-box-containing protein